jgi:hypothetical protein
MLLPWIALAGGVLALVVLACYPLLVAQAGRRRLAVLGAGAVLLPLPLLVPSGAPASALVRFHVAVAAVLVTWKLYDLHVGFPTTGRPPFGRYLAFLTSVMGHAVYRRRGSEPGPDRAGNVRRLVRGLLELALGGVALYVLFGRLDLGATSFALEHAAKWVALYVAADGGLLVGVALHRLLGADVLDVYRDPVLGRTPADLWRRYNRIVGEWLFVNVYRRPGLRRRPAAATMASFAVSAVMHEYLFAIALGRLQGFQLAFFLSHGLAAVLTYRLRPKGWQVPLGVALTVLFTLATLVLFTASVHDVLAPLGLFYAHGRPSLWAD